jgi:hypothetical protein
MPEEFPTLPQEEIEFCRENPGYLYKNDVYAAMYSSEFDCVLIMCGNLADSTEAELKKDFKEMIEYRKTNRQS